MPALRLSLALAAASLTVASVQERARPRPGGEIDRLRWMAGCWELRTETRVTHEQWMAPLGGMMLGMSRTVVRDTTRESEHVRVESRAGVLTFVAQPSGQPVAAFAATSVTDTLVAFANPAHDFPQRIIYRRVGRDSLVARIEGERGGKVRGADFAMARTSCGG